MRYSGKQAQTTQNHNGGFGEWTGEGKDAEEFIYQTQEIFSINILISKVI